MLVLGIVHGMDFFITILRELTRRMFQCTTRFWAKGLFTTLALAPQFGTRFPCNLFLNLSLILVTSDRYQCIYLSIMGYPVVGPGSHNVIDLQLAIYLMCVHVSSLVVQAVQNAIRLRSLMSASS